MRNALSIAAALFILAACAPPKAVAPAVSEAIVATPPNGAKVAAAYLTIQNAGAADTLVAVDSPIADRVEMHETISENGMMKMRPLTGVAVPAGGEVVFAPGGKHLMLFLKEPLQEGADVSAVLHFATSGDIPITLRVQQPAIPDSGMGGMGMSGAH